VPHLVAIVSLEIVATPGPTATEILFEAAIATVIAPLGPSTADVLPPFSSAVIIDSI
jgi:hypothetical protein